MKYPQTLIGVGITSFAMSAVFALLPPQSRTQPTQAAVQPFSHEDCQYPGRWSNPANGCDNSDPAVPECTKAMYSQKAERDCTKAFVKAHEPSKKAVKPSKPTPPKVTKCGGQ